MSAKRATVVGLGLCVIDHLYLVEAQDPRAERQNYRDRRVSVGGMVTNALAQVARLGARAELVTQLGDDPDGVRARRELRTLGIGTRSVQVSRAMPTTVAVVFVDPATGERRFLTAPRAKLEARVRGLDLAAIRPGRVLLVDGHFPSQLRRAARRARKHGVPVVGDLSDARPAYVALLPYLDRPVLPEGFVRAWHRGTPSDAIRRLHDEFGAEAVVTQGSRGGLYWNDGRVARYRSPRVTVRDTTGAGDAFHGAFAVGLAEGLPLADNVARAARAGATACTRVGATAKLLGRSAWERVRATASR
ncbi:MAG: PfkB family carbohydrate kinase [Myxococcota bacterium]